jgi:hypothetical protein
MDPHGRPYFSHMGPPSHIVPPYHVAPPSHMVAPSHMVSPYMQPPPRTLLHDPQIDPRMQQLERAFPTNCAEIAFQVTIAP